MVEEQVETRKNVTGKNAYSCKFCTKVFSDSGTAKNHERIHTGEKPYSCKYCTKKFSFNKTLKSHEKVHINKGHDVKNNESEMIHFCRFCKMV